MIYLYCERCHERRLFLPAEEQPPFDPHTSMCCACGFSFGYQQIEKREGGGRIEVVTRPVLEQHVVVAGLEAFERERMQQIAAKGMAIEHRIAQKQFEATFPEPGASAEVHAKAILARQRLTSATQGTIAPALAEKILRPRVPSRE